MKKLFILLSFLIAISAVHAQNEARAASLVKEGNTLNDSEDYKGASVKFDSALVFDKNNLAALIGKTTSVIQQGEYYKTIDQCEYILKKFKHADGLKPVYINYADALNDIRKYSEGEKISSKAIELFPNDYRLYFCKAACLSNDGKDDEALPYYEKTVLLDSGFSQALTLSNFTIGRIMDSKGKHVQSLLALCKYVIEVPRASRAKRAMEMVMEQLQGSSKKGTNGSTTIYIDNNMMESGTKDGEPALNNFSSTSLILAFMGALNGVDTMLHQTAAQSFKRKFEMVCSSLKEKQDSGFGFYWNYYAAYFIEMYNKDYLETFSNIAFLPMENTDAEAWIKENDQKVKDFYKWSSGFTWKR